MSRKSNRLRSKVNHLTQIMVSQNGVVSMLMKQTSGLGKQLVDAALRADRAQAEAARARNEASILGPIKMELRRLRPEFGDVHSMQVSFRPEMFCYAMRGASRFQDVSLTVRSIARQIAEQVEKTLFDELQKQGMA